MADQPMADRPRHTIRVAVRRTGLSADTLRAWERRYGAVQPARSDTERRLYSDADLARLRLLRECVAHGHTIASVAQRPLEELEQLVAEERGFTTSAAASSADAAMPTPVAGRVPGTRRVEGPEAAQAARAILARCESAVHEMDGEELRRGLVRAIVELGPTTFIDEVAVPLCQRIGDLWANGTLTVAHEHVASVALRGALDFLLDTLRPVSPAGPRLVVATPSGYRHEFGAMMAGALAGSIGWHVTYLGADLPADSIAEAVHQADARVLALSLVGPAGDVRLDEELRRLRQQVGGEITIIVGGSYIEDHARLLDGIGARTLPSLQALRAELTALAATGGTPRLTRPA